MPNVLVVEDDACLRELLHLHLSNAGYEVTLAEDAVEAIKLLLRTRPSLMMVDVELPYMSGLGLVRTMKDEPELAAIPVVLLRKPLVASELLSAVQAALPARARSAGRR